MKKFTLLILVMLMATGMALAQNPIPPGWTPGAGTTPTAPSTTPPSNWPSPPTLSNGANNVALSQDVLGAHNGYGRGCVMCHAPHGGALGNNAPSGQINAISAATASSDTGNGTGGPLWGENLAPYYGQTVSFVGTYTVTLPASASAANAANNSGAQIVLLCLSCHDGALTKPAMMQGWTVEALPIVGGAAPTLFGATAGNNPLSYTNEHPVGQSVSGSSWGCASGVGGASGLPINPTNCTSAAFTAFTGTNYKASLWNYPSNPYYSLYPLASFTGSASGGTTKNGVTCTTCHNQHSMTVYTNSKGSFPTMFFINGEYMPSSGGNSVAQFCRNCHASESNEMSGLLSVPTT